MKKYTKAVVSVFLLFSFLLFSGGVSYEASAALPEKLRIGLYYEGSAAASFNIGADNGLNIGCYKDNTFNVLYEHNSGEEILVRKDAYFAVNNGIYKEYTQSSIAGAAGDKAGPFHVQLGAGYTDYTAAVQQAEMFKQYGIAAYPAYKDGWQVWTGFYIDQSSAQADITNNFEKVLGTGVCNIVQPDSNRIIVAGKNGSVILAFGASNGVFQVYPKPLSDKEVFKLNNKKYRGGLEVRRFSGSDMTLINVLPFEQYLYGVVPCEIESYSPPEALKAQAVVARTYGLVQMGRHGKWSFDLCPTQHCQVYRGFDAEAASTTKAVEDTKGKIVTYSGKPATTVYFASSGGWTESVENVWGSPYPYLKSVEDKYEPDTSSHYYWTKNISASKIAEVTKAKAGKDIGEVTGVIINKLTAAKRVLELEVKGTSNSYIYPRETFRTSMGLDSGMYTVSSDADVAVWKADNNKKVMQAGNTSAITAGGIKTTTAKGNITILGKDGQKKVVPAVPANYTFTGKGWGHGVGMSQEGAKGMAKAGFTYEQILQYYYKDVKVE